MILPDWDFTSIIQYFIIMFAIDIVEQVADRWC